MQRFKNKLLITTIVVTSIFFTLIGRLVYLQILRGDEFEKFSHENRIRLSKTPAPRGKILDRHGKKLVVNRPSFDIKVFPNEIENSEDLSEKLSEILEISQIEIQNKIEKAINKKIYTPLTIENDIDRDTLALLEGRKAYLKGVTIEVNYLRDYPNGKLGSLVLGYLGKANETDIETFSLPDLNLFVGKSGIEKSFENSLRGINGLNYMVIDALGRQVKSNLFKEDIQNKETQSGNNIHLTIDIEIQKVAEESLGENMGSIAVVEVNTGEVLALASSPSFDPHQFINGIDKKDWEILQNNAFYPMLNRSTQGTYAPGSTFKIVTALAALNESVIDPETKVFCPGYYKVGKKKFRCWKQSGHGWVNLYKAISQSCDVYFYNAAEKLGIDKFSEYIKLFGFGSETGIEISEKGGIAPSRQWKQKKYKKPWYKGDTVVTGIGQGYINSTPLQIALMTAAVANGGTLLKPMLVKKITAADGKTQVVFSSEAIRKLPFSEYKIKVVQESLVGVVNDKRGTGRRASIKNATVAGKTGTSQVISMNTKSEKYIHKDHAWFTSYFPAENPEIAVTVLVEHGGKGGSVAAPLAKRVIEEYINLSNGDNKDDDV